jgi:serine acetyltransferase
MNYLGYTGAFFLLVLSVKGAVCFIEEYQFFNEAFIGAGLFISFFLGVVIYFTLIKK